MQIHGKGTVCKTQYGYIFCEKQKELDGHYEDYFYPIKFRKELELPQEEKQIEIFGFMKFYKTKEGKANSYYFVMSYEYFDDSKKQKEPRKYRYFVVRLEKNLEYKYEVHKALDGANVRWNIDKNIPDYNYSKTFHFDQILDDFETLEEAENCIKEILQRKQEKNQTENQLNLNNWLE